MNVSNNVSLSLDQNNIDKAVSDFEGVLFKAAESMIVQNGGYNIRNSELSKLKQKKRNKLLGIFRKQTQMSP